MYLAVVLVCSVLAGECDRTSAIMLLRVPQVYDTPRSCAEGSIAWVQQAQLELGGGHRAIVQCGQGA